MRPWFSALMILVGLNANSYNPTDTTEYLKAFHADPARVMNAPLRHEMMKQSQTNSMGPIANEAERELMFEYRGEIRGELCGSNNQRCSPPAERFTHSQASENDQVLNFLETRFAIDELSRMEVLGWTESRVPIAPWSDSYWPIAKGMIGRRYADSRFPNSTWKANYSYVVSNPAWGGNVDVSAMAPSEKYDLLVGDTSWTLTKGVWDRGRAYYDRYGVVPGWTGLCHGWAPASFMYPQPMRTVTVKGARGQMIPFYPSDIKALASLLQAEVKPKKKFIGKRCFTSRPPIDEVGRITDEHCFNNNPATWHVAITNQIAGAKKSFVFDATFDFEVWNYPVSAYRYHYFNPQSLASSQKLATSVIPIKKFTIDKFKKYRSPRAKYVVGISMDVFYSSATLPTPNYAGDPIFKKVVYVYDLELDDQYKIIGGEWYSNLHPDFIWKPTEGYRALSYGERKLGVSANWDGSTDLPEELLNAARLSSPLRQPLSEIVEGLVELAQ